MLIFEWFHNHPALRYGRILFDISNIVYLFSIFMEKYKISKKLSFKKIKVLIAITFIIFVYRNYQRINYKIETYDYRPLKIFIIESMINNLIYKIILIR